MELGCGVVVKGTSWETAKVQHVDGSLGRCNPPGPSNGRPLLSNWLEDVSIIQ
jgi:hypothetical protein